MGDGLMTLEELGRSVQAQRKSLSNLTSLVSIGEAMSKEGWDVAFQLSGVTGASIHVAFDGSREDDDVADLEVLFPEIVSAFRTMFSGNKVARSNGSSLVEDSSSEVVDLPSAPVTEGGDVADIAPVANFPAADAAKADTGAAYLTGPYTEGEEAKIAQLYGAGKSVPEIAEVLGRRNQSVGCKIRYMDRAGLLPAAPEPAPIAAPAVAAVEPDLSPEALAYLGKLKGLKADPAFDAVTELAMCKALLDGQKQNMVAADLGVDGKAMMKRYRLICGSAVGVGKMATDALIEALQYRADVAKLGGGK